ncbi:hypothetical protein [Nocardioides sp. cx-173]|nr:hypothetical protein [Nocardioides sp. cx-173]
MAHDTQSGSAERRTETKMTAACVPVLPQVTGQIAGQGGQA